MYFPDWYVCIRQIFHFFRHSNVKRCYFCTVLCIHLLRFYSQLLSLSGYLSLLLWRSHDSSSTFPDLVLVEKPCSLKQTHQEECSTLFKENLTRIFTTYQFLHFTCSIWTRNLSYLVYRYSNRPFSHHNTLLNHETADLWNVKQWEWATASSFALAVIMNQSLARDWAVWTGDHYTLSLASFKRNGKHLRRGRES